MDRVENTVSQLVYSYVLGICYGHHLATAVVYTVIT
jgi:GMP synthase-like glutamine amidotransferase